MKFAKSASAVAVATAMAASSSYTRECRQQRLAYEPDPGAFGATLTFYDASGNVVTSGITTATPIGGHAVALMTGRAATRDAMNGAANPRRLPVWNRTPSAGPTTTLRPLVTRRTSWTWQDPPVSKGSRAT